VYMDGCGPCNATRPEWEKLKGALETKYKSNDDVVVADINKDFIDDVKYIGSIDGFPTLKHVSAKGKNVESYEECGHVREKNRSVDSFVQWIEVYLNDGENMSVESSSSPSELLKRLAGGKRKKTKKVRFSVSKKRKVRKTSKRRGRKLRRR